MRRRYRGCTIITTVLEEPILVARGRRNVTTTTVFKVVFPDKTWIYCGTTAWARKYIDEVLHLHGRAS